MTGPSLRLSRLLAALVLPLVAVAVAAREDPAKAPVPEDKARLVVKLPAEAKLTIGTNDTASTGPERTFLTPPLKPGVRYSYELKATWADGGQTKTETREVVLRAGETVEVDFSKPAPTPEKEKPPAVAKSRTFQFTYAVTLTDLPPDKVAHVWVPLATSSDDQTVELVSKKLPGEAREGTDKLYGNHTLYLEAKAGPDGKLPLEIVYKVMRKEVRMEDAKAKPEDTIRLARYLEPDRLGPLDAGPLQALVAGKAIPSDKLGAARAIYDIVFEHMKYDKTGTGWGKGDVVWACESRHGNCADFHSLFISLMRARKIPAKFEAGFGLPAKRGDGDAVYHCWAWFRTDDKGWIPVDISEASKDPKMKDYYFGHLTPDRVAFSTGRDIELTPKQAGEPLNFFVYPYVEIDGKEAGKQERKFHYHDAE